MTKSNLIVSVLATLSFVACAASPSRELLDARRAYAHASEGTAATAVPADLHKARVSLDRAESAFHNGDADQRDLAYVAERKAQLAEVLATRAAHADVRASAEATLASDKDANRVQTKAELERTKSSLAGAERDAADQKQRATEADTRAAEADQRTAEADRRMKALQLELAKWAAVKEEPRGVVITLSGSVLFASNKSTLLPEAKTRLGQVATALLETKERHLAVEGYTDSQGKDAYNIDLSQRRADAVRTYLVANGYPPDLIVAHGAGKAMPVADNATAEGRANNRRVEIIIAARSADVSSR
jgi:outer membrane protein OmpA-like peptidoglycan-associated protein